MTWNYHTEGTTLHVWPSVDLPEHELDGMLCWCRTKIYLYPNGNAQVVHKDLLDRQDYVS